MPNRSDEAKKSEVLSFLHEHVFDPVLLSPTASVALKQGIRLTITRMNERDAKGIVHFYWSAISGTDRSNMFAKRMRQEGFKRFEEIIEEFRERFDNKWLAT
jgi:predicted glycosyl hydrolase (DUF1957 family)